MRTKYIIAFLAVLVGLPYSVAGQTIAVRSGAHEGFSRLVLRIPDGSEWNLEQTGLSAMLRFEDYQGRFDVSSVYELIDRRYISDVLPVPSGLDIQLACNCEVNSFEVNGGYLAIDVSLLPDMQFSTTTLTTDLGWPRPQTILRFPGGSAPKPRQKTESKPPNLARIQRQETEGTSEALRSIASDTLLQALPEPEADGLSVTAQQLARAQQKLSKRVAIAATQGILQPNRPISDLPLQRTEPQIDVSIFDSSQPEMSANSQMDEGGTVNIRVTSSSDIPSQTLVNGLESTSMGAQCIQEISVDVGSWGTDVAPMARVSQLRSDLFSETDRLNNNIALELARLYLHYGFGAEAKQVLLLDPDLAQQNPELVAIAEIMEFGSAIDSEYLPQFADCSNSVALWAILAKDSLTPTSTINVDAALRGLTALPIHLRRFIAPKLSRRFLEHGDEASAATALRSIERTPNPLTADAELARAELQMAKGETEAARKTLAEVVASNEHQSAEALIQFVDSHLQADTLIDQSVATLVEAYAVEMRDDPLGAELKRTHVLALAKSGQFDEAFEALERIRARDDGTIELELRTSLIDIASKNASDVVFLEHVFDHVETERSLASPRTSILVAERLAALGFAQMAETVLDMQDDLPNTSRLKELRARIALNLERPFEAEAILFGVEGENADRLRARAKKLDEDYLAASVLFSELGDNAESMRSAWLAEDWDRIAATESNPFAPVVDLIATPIEDSGEPEGMLGRMSDAVAESARARDVIQSLLRSTSSDPQP